MNWDDEGVGLESRSFNLFSAFLSCWNDGAVRTSASDGIEKSSRSTQWEELLRSYEKSSDEIVELSQS